MSKLIGSLSLLGLLFGLCFSLEFVFVSERTREERVAGLERTKLLWMATMLTPALFAGCWLMSRVPPEGLVSKRNGYPWEVYLAFPILAFVMMACISTVLYMLYETVIDLLAGKTMAAFDHATAGAACVAYSFVASKFAGAMETRAARARGRERVQAKKRHSAEAEKKKREMEAMGATILDADDDEFDTEPSNFNHDM